MFKYIFLIFILIFTGCSNKTWTLDGKVIKENNIRENSFTQKNYVNISKDAILEAGKKVFILADKKEFRIDSYRDKIIASRTKMNNYIFMQTTHEDFWTLSINENNNISHVKLELYRITNFDEENIEYIEKGAHELLWKRIEYLLGLTDKWTSCSEYWDFNKVLCDSFDLSNFKEAKNEDIVNNILISDRQKNQSLNKTNEDILKDDIELIIDDSKDDILAKEDKESDSDKSMDKEIEELDKKVNENIDNTLDKIVDDRLDEDDKIDK